VRASFAEEAVKARVLAEIDEYATAAGSTGPRND